MWQLRQEFDSGASVHLSSEHSVHDVASLLKEYLRDLPDPLLTHELFPAFLASAGTDQPTFSYITCICCDRCCLCCNWKITSVVYIDGTKFNSFLLWWYCYLCVETIDRSFDYNLNIADEKYFHGTAFGGMTLSNSSGNVFKINLLIVWLICVFSDWRREQSRINVTTAGCIVTNCEPRHSVVSSHVPWLRC